MPVQTTRTDYQHACHAWRRLRDCYDGRDAILKAGHLYCPNLPGADEAENRRYRERGTFFGATARTVQGLVGAIFQKPPEVAVPPAVAAYLTNITLANVSFEQFAVDGGREIMLMGRYGVLVDMVAAPATDQRPYLVGYRAEDIINWRTSRTSGDEVLTLVVLKESVEIVNPDDLFLETRLVQYRVISLINNACVQQLWREVEGKAGEFELFGPPITLMRRGVALPFVPFVIMGSCHATPDLEKPPLLDMVDVNLAHWRNSVDHEYGLHLIALPTPWVSGAKGAGEGPMKIGPSVVWELEANGRAGMLELSGQGLSAIAAAMDVKRLQMAALGARLLEEATRGDTATAVLIRHSGESASLRSVAGSMEQGFTLVLQLVAWWDGVEATPQDAEAHVELNKEYLDVKATAQEVQVALTALQAGEIPFVTWWNFLTQGGWAREGIDAAAERKEIDSQAGSVIPEPIVPDYVINPDTGLAEKPTGGPPIIPPVPPKPPVQVPPPDPTEGA